jgi:hypothetical protein
MAKNIREYQSIKFFRGRKRNNAEMQRLADAGMDFEYRRLLIEENELDLHVNFSRMIVYKWLSWSLLALAFSCLQHPILIFMVLVFALISIILSFIYKKKFQLVFRCYNFALAILDGVILNEYGISLR